MNSPNHVHLLIQYFLKLQRSSFFRVPLYQVLHVGRAHIGSVEIRSSSPREKTQETASLHFKKAGKHQEHQISSSRLFLNLFPNTNHHCYFELSGTLIRLVLTTQYMIACTSQYGLIRLVRRIEIALMKRESIQTEVLIQSRFFHEAYFNEYK